MERINYVHLKGQLHTKSSVLISKNGAKYQYFTLKIFNRQEAAGDKTIWDYVQCIAFNKYAEKISKIPLKTLLTVKGEIMAPKRKEKQDFSVNVWAIGEPISEQTIDNKPENND
ncbi:single-stranded DNA-binding protein [Mycoplasmopsis primatum]|uniref:single-stranded DNA-binding protein n=1 Tax=Mycoplasmopsis primatum TaxID=55604 RepID=UPI0004954974|nr:single-stranded DNA-binding protein [Mycoplasmopsis primatum]